VDDTEEEEIEHSTEFAMETHFRDVLAKVMGQLLYYMGWVDAHIGSGTKPCRGIIIASDIPEELKLAVSQVPRVKLKRYKMSFSIEQV
jgi:hypothetical protein